MVKESSRTSDFQIYEKQTNKNKTNKNTFLVPFICQSIDYIQLFQQILTNFYLRIWANCSFNIAKFRNNMISMTIPSCYDNDNIDDDDKWVPDGFSVDSSISVKLKPWAIFKNYNLLQASSIFGEKW